MAFAKRIVALSGPPLIAGAGVYLLHSLPDGVLEFLVAWTLLSLPIGMMIGHFALSED